MKAVITIGFLLAITTGFAQSSKWEKCSWLVGQWKGVGDGQPGKGEGVFSFKEDLDQKVLVRKSHSEYPGQKGKPSVIHDDLMIVYLDDAGNPGKAIYFDNEGHTIHYSVSYMGKEVVFLSDRISNTPVFRLTYTEIDDQTVNTRFEISRDGEHFMTYIEGRSVRVKS